MNEMTFFACTGQVLAEVDNAFGVRRLCCLVTSAPFALIDDGAFDRLVCLVILDSD